MSRALPTPRSIDPASVPRLRWGIVGSGWIAARFARALTVRTTQRLTAIASRNARTAAALASDWGIPTVHPTAEALMSDPAVDVAYVAAPHVAHRDLALQAIAAGKHVLVEKPMAISAADGADIVRAARSAGVFVMEAMWTRYLPSTDVIRTLLADGALGEVQLVTADVGFVAPFEPRGQLWTPSMAGGALLDVGIYPVSFASWVMGPPSRVLASGTRTASGVDGHVEMLLATASGSSALLAASMVAASPTKATIVGSAARIELASPFYASSGLVVTFQAGAGEDSVPWQGEPLDDVYDALGHQATALAVYVGEGRTESPLHTLAETLSVLGTLDAVRAQIP